MASLFFSYSHRDEEMRNQLETHLVTLRRQRIIEMWHDRRIGAGRELDGEIDQHLRSADIILLLVSPDFIASDYCYDREMEMAMNRHEQGAARVIPVILEPCDWRDLPFGKLMATPKDGKPVSKYPNRNDAFLEVVLSVKNAAKELGLGTAQSAIRSPAPTDLCETMLVGPSRSSNLRVKRVFSDRDRDRFLSEALEYMATYFESSLAELSARNPQIEVDFNRVDKTHFYATVYRIGDMANRCTVRLGGLGHGSKGISYVSEHTVNDNTLNALLSVDDDGFAMFLKPSMGIQAYSGGDGLSLEGAAEAYWELLIAPLQ